VLPRRSLLITVSQLGVGLAVIAIAPAATAIAAVDPAAMIHQLGSQALAILRPGTPPAQRAAGFRRLFRDNFAVGAIARFVLGPYWRIATPEQRQQFVELLESYVAGVYAQKLADYSGGALRVVATRADGVDGATVTTQAVKPNGGPPVTIDWRLIRVDGSFKISDVIVDNISMATTERAQFASIIERSGGQVDGLLAALRDKTAGLGAAPGSGE
jgi:phospholipid transport system substrate-binding protein